MKYEGELDDTVVKFVRSLPTYAGVSFDQRDGGRPTVRLTQLESTTVAAIRELDPDPSRGLRDGTVLSPISNEIGDDPNGTLYRQDGKDIMRGTLSDAQASRQIYAEGSVIQMKASATPIVGQAIVFSGARTNAIVTGTVQVDWRSWTSETAGFRVWGGDASWTTIKGDSGAPVYRRVFVTSPIPGWQITPIGTNSHQNGYFARVFDAQIAWDLTMYNQ